MSELRVDSVKSKGGGAPNLPKGVTISGIATAVTLGATSIDVSNVNVSGVVTSGTLSGNLTGTPTLGLGVTINASGLHITGVATAGIVSATTLYGDGANVTGLAVSVSPWYYNPDVYTNLVSTDTGIGITFNQQILAGSGDITVRMAGAAGTVVENFGVGSSVTISENRVNFTLTDELTGGDTVYYVSYPSGCFTDNVGNSYVGTAYTFATRELYNQLWTWGQNTNGELGVNDKTDRSSPVQVPGTTWSKGAGTHNDEMCWQIIKTDGTLWTWGRNDYGIMGINEAHTAKYSSPIQVGSDTTWAQTNGATDNVAAVKTDGTLWVWGENAYGQLCNGNDTVKASSPVQIPGTTWATGYKQLFAGGRQFGCIRTDGTLWMWGSNNNGCGGTNQAPSGSGAPGNSYFWSPRQVPGSTWSKGVVNGKAGTYVIKTDGTLWSWGYQFSGQLGHNETFSPSKRGYSSPVQIPGTTWSDVSGIGESRSVVATKTDGTLWSWGYNTSGELGQNNRTDYSSPVQVPGTTWSKIANIQGGVSAVKTDGTLWMWGADDGGQLGQNSEVKYSSPIQVGTDTTWDSPIPGGRGQVAAIKKG